MNADRLYSGSKNPVTSDPFVDPTVHRHDRQSAEVIVNYHGFELVPQHEHITIKPQLQITAAVSGKSNSFHMVPKDREALHLLRFVRQIGGNDSATRVHHLPIALVNQPPPAARSVIWEGRHVRLERLPVGLKHRMLRRNHDQHMHVIRQQMPLLDPAILLQSQLVEDFPKVPSNMPK
jgi:hypothetical protein